MSDGVQTLLDVIEDNHALDHLFKESLPDDSSRFETSGEIGLYNSCLDNFVYESQFVDPNRTTNSVSSHVFSHVVNPPTGINSSTSNNHALLSNHLQNQHHSSVLQNAAHHGLGSVELDINRQREQCGRQDGELSLHQILSSHANQNSGLHSIHNPAPIISNQHQIDAGISQLRHSNYLCSQKQSQLPPLDNVSDGGTLSNSLQIGTTSQNSIQTNFSDGSHFSSKLSVSQNQTQAKVYTSNNSLGVPALGKVQIISGHQPSLTSSSPVLSGNQLSGHIITGNPMIPVSQVSSLLNSGQVLSGSYSISGAQIIANPLLGNQPKSSTSIGVLSSSTLVPQNTSSGNLVSTSIARSQNTTVTTGSSHNPVTAAPSCEILSNQHVEQSKSHRSQIAKVSSSYVTKSLKSSIPVVSPHSSNSRKSPVSQKSPVGQNSSPSNASENVGVVTGLTSNIPIAVSNPNVVLAQTNPIKQIVPGGQLIQLVSPANQQKAAPITAPKPIQPKQQQILPKPSQGSRSSTTPPSSKAFITPRASAPSTQAQVVLGSSSTPTVIAGQNALGGLVLNSPLLQPNLQHPLIITQPGGIQFLVRPPATPAPTLATNQTMILPFAGPQVMTSVGKVGQQLLGIPANGQATPTLLLPATSQISNNIFNASRNPGTPQLLRFVTPAQSYVLHTQNGPTLLPIQTAQTGINLPSVITTPNNGTVRTISNQIPLQIMNPLQGVSNIISTGYQAPPSLQVSSSASSIVNTSVVTTAGSNSQVLKIEDNKKSDNKNSKKKDRTPKRKKNTKEEDKEKPAINLNELLKVHGISDDPEMIFDENDFNFVEGEMMPPIQESSSNIPVTSNSSRLPSSAMSTGAVCVLNSQEGSLPLSNKITVTVASVKQPDGSFSYVNFHGSTTVSNCNVTPVNSKPILSLGQTNVEPSVKVSNIISCTNENENVISKPSDTKLTLSTVAVTSPSVVSLSTKGCHNEKQEPISVLSSVPRINYLSANEKNIVSKISTNEKSKGHKSRNKRKSDTEEFPHKKVKRTYEAKVSPTKDEVNSSPGASMPSLFSSLTSNAISSKSTNVVLPSSIPSSSSVHSTKPKTTQSIIHSTNIIQNSNLILGQQNNHNQQVVLLPQNNPSQPVVLPPGQVKQLVLSPANQEAFTSLCAKIQAIKARGPHGDNEAILQKLIAEQSRIASTGKVLDMSNANNIIPNQRSPVKYSHSIGHKKIILTPNSKKNSQSIKEISKSESQTVPLVSQAVCSSFSTSNTASSQVSPVSKSLKEKDTLKSTAASYQSKSYAQPHPVPESFNRSPSQQSIKSSHCTPTLGTNTRTSSGSTITQEKLFDHQLKTDQNGAIYPDYCTPFKHKTDACKRLIRYHVFNEPEMPKREILAEDNEFNLRAEALMRKMNSMKNKYQALLLRDSERPHASADMTLIHRLATNEEKSIFEREKNEVKNGREIKIDLASPVIRQVNVPTFNDVLVDFSNYIDDTKNDKEYVYDENGKLCSVQKLHKRHEEKKRQLEKELAREGSQTLRIELERLNPDRLLSHRNINEESMTLNHVSDEIIRIEDKNDSEEECLHIDVARSPEPSTPKSNCDEDLNKLAERVRADFSSDSEEISLLHIPNNNTNPYSQNFLKSSPFNDENFLNSNHVNRSISELNDTSDKVNAEKKVKRHKKSKYPSKDRDRDKEKYKKDKNRKYDKNRYSDKESDRVLLKDSYDSKGIKLTLKKHSSDNYVIQNKSSREIQFFPTAIDS